MIVWTVEGILKLIGLGILIVALLFCGATLLISCIVGYVEQKCRNKTKKKEER